MNFIQNFYRQILIFLGVFLLSLFFIFIGKQVVASTSYSLELTMNSTPLVGTEVYEGLTVHFQLGGFGSGMDSGEFMTFVTSVSSTELTCNPVADQEVLFDGFVTIIIDCVVSATASGAIDLPSITVTANGENIPINTNGHSGFVMAGDVMLNTNTDQEFLGTTSLSLAQHPNRLLNGVAIDTAGTIVRRSVKNTEDKADITQSEVSFVQIPHSPEFFVYPESESSNVFNYSYSVSINYGCSNSCCDTTCPVSQNYSSDLPLSVGQTPPGTKIRVYNPVITSQVNHLTEVGSTALVFTVKVSIPTDYPALEFADSTGVLYEENRAIKTKSYNNIITNTTNFIRDGGLFNIPKEDFKAYAIQNGKNGVIKVEVIATAQRTVWEYQEVNRGSITCWRKDGHDTEDGCDRDDKEDFAVSYPILAWRMVEGPEEISFTLIDSTTVDVFSSAAWVQTKGGNMGTNNDIAGEGTDSNLFKFSTFEDVLGDTETWSGGGVGAQTAPKNFTPYNQNNADFMIFSNSIDEGKEFEFSSAANWYTNTSNEDANVFSNKVEQKYGYGLQGDEYDRENDLFPRNYEEDLQEREIFGEVIDFSTITDFSDYTTSAEAGVHGDFTCNHSTNTCDIKKRLVLKQGKIYFFPEGYTVNLGDPYSDLLLEGSSTRLHVLGKVNILGNILYATQSAKNFLEIPNLRIDGRDEVIVSGNVEFIESQIRTQIFKSGISDIQLKILGDVIAKKTEFQRTPVGVFNPEELENNPSSELIIEDLRKYVLPAPGDTILREAQSVWQQVNPMTGEVVEPY